MKKHKKIGLSLSGGGIRAAVFHLGVLSYLAEHSVLENILEISTVSGGSLIVGAIFSYNELNWPSSNDYINKTYPALRDKLISTDLFSLSAFGWKGILKANVHLLCDRSKLFPELLSSQWGIYGSLKDLPNKPEWYINTTCYETGKNWRFSKKIMGDWQFGRYFGPDISLAKSIAASAAVPYALGAVKLHLPEDGWWETNPATKKPIKKIIPSPKKIRLWDGGAYENMGLEAIYKPDKGLLASDLLICSDASGPLNMPQPFSLIKMLQGKLHSPRLFDISSDQIRALRSRMLMGSIKRGDIEGAILRIGTPSNQFSSKHKNTQKSLSDEDRKTALNYPTNLTRISEKNFDLIARHGYETCRDTIENYTISFS